ncbi:MAG TPA: hypothetical protein VEG65_05710 [Candidatus Bathyarchaeia archaeon]|nr:hypothetical protein [Candidatus Bathyarchaeia archaeon]
MSAYKWAVLLVATAGLLLSGCAVANGQTTQHGVVKISWPAKNGKAGPTELVSGKAQLSKGYSLWIVPHDPTTGKYYPQAAPVAVHSGATWASRLAVGSIFAVGKTFQIQAVVADQSAGSALSSYAARGTGTTKLPTGAQAVDSVTVTRVSTDVSAAPSASPQASAVLHTTSPGVTSVPSTMNVAQASASGRSQNPLPGFEVLYALGALLVAFFVLRSRRR